MASQWPVPGRRSEELSSANRMQSILVVRPCRFRSMMEVSSVFSLPLHLPIYPHLSISPQALIVWPTEVQFSKVSPGFPHCFVSLLVHSKGHLPKICERLDHLPLDMISPRPISAWLSLAPQSSHLPVEQKSLLPSAPEKQKNNETPWLSAKHVCAATAATAPRKSE